MVWWGVMRSCRVGLSFQVPKELEEVSWFGLGPHENYPDRKRGALLDIHHSQAKDLYVPYVMPGETLKERGDHQGVKA